MFLSTLLIILILYFIMFSALKVSSNCARMEEEMNKER